jgi:F0F1-type ATP synthase membrane subunit b/b'
MKSIQEAENKFREAEENLSNAKKSLEMAKTKAEQIRKNGQIISNQTLKALLDTSEEDIKRLKQTVLLNLKLEEEKSINEICQKLTNLALDKAIEKLKKKLNPTTQQKILIQNIEKFSSAKLPKYKYSKY